MSFAIIEVGSTTTKAYIFRDSEIIDTKSIYIAFKTNYSANGKLLNDDIKKLFDFIEEIKKVSDEIYIYGTSIFRKISEEEKTGFINELKNKFDIDFKIVTADEESTYTVKGVINNIDYNSKMAVVIGGGGSTEIAVIEDKKIIEKINLDFGAMDITDAFPELKNDIVETKFNTILDYTMQKVGEINNNADVLVLAGGNYIYFYQKANYEMENNFLYKDDNQPYLLDFDTLNDYDEDILHKSLDEIKKRCPDNTNWWDGARGMRFCMNAVARKLNSKYIIPTKINMIIGIADEIINNK